MNQAQILRPGTWHLTPPPEPANWGIGIRAQMAAADRVLRSALRGERHMSVRGRQGDFVRSVSADQVKPRPVPVRGVPFEIRRAPAVKVVAPAATDSAPTPDTKTVLACVTAASSKGISHGEICEQLKCGAHNLGAVLNRLVKRGVIWPSGARKSYRYHPSR